MLMDVRFFSGKLGDTRDKVGSLIYRTCGPETVDCMRKSVGREFAWLLGLADETEKLAKCEMLWKKRESELGCEIRGR
jgi:hypothetical protein